MNEPDHKKCNQCKAWLKITEFYTAGKRSDGSTKHSHICKNCDKKNKRDDYHNEQKHVWIHKRAYIRARSRALTRLSKLVPELYDLVLSQELEKEGVPRIPKTDPRSRRSITVDTKQDRSNDD